MSVEDKRDRLGRIVAGLGSVGVAYSGGTDSSYLLAVCLDVLGSDRVAALTADSPLTPRSELAQSQAVASILAVRHVVLPSDDLSEADIVANLPDRCYHCKKRRFGLLLEVTGALGYHHLVHGENADDIDDYRPGSLAAAELGVRAPLLEACLTKQEVRILARRRGLPNWDLPSNACLASRFPYGTPLTAHGLARVEAAEEVLRRTCDLGQLRVRDHFPTARIEVPHADIARLAEPATRASVVELLRSLGYGYVTLDLVGYRTGSLNETPQ